MQVLVVVLALLVVLLLGFQLWIFSRSKSDSSVGLIQQQLTSLHEQVVRSMGDVTQATGSLVQGSQQAMGERLDRTSGLFAQLTERLSRLEQATQQIYTVGEEVSKLQEILRAPKLRGNLGELFLEEILSQMLPAAHYELQYAFRDGQKVDAVIRLSQGHLVPIDAKFPLENFQRMVSTHATDGERHAARKTFGADFKKHVDAIAAKYIRPDEQTLDFAMMYVPAENVYYEAILKDDHFGESGSINSYALAKKVIPVSPNSLYAYLQAILLGLKGLKIEAEAKQIFAFLARLHGEFQRFRDDLELVGKHVGNAKSAYDRTEKRFEQIESKFHQLKEPETGAPPVEPLKIISNV